MAVKVKHKGAWVDISTASVAGTTKCAILEDQKASNTNGGTFTSGAWRDRTLNSETDPQGFVTLDSGNVYFSLAAGTYEIDWSAPATMVDKHQSRLMFATNTGFSSGVGYVYGSSEMVDQNETPNIDCTRSFGRAIKTITQTTYFKIQHRCSTTKADDGFGTPNNFTGDSQVEVYTQVVIKDLASAVKDNATYVEGKSRVGTVKDVKAYNVNGGVFTNNKWIVRDLNTISDPSSIGITSTTGGLVYVPAGTYNMSWRAPGYHCNDHTSRLAYSANSTVNADNQLTSSVTYVTGETSYSDTEFRSFTYSTGVVASVTFTGTTYIQIQHFSDEGESANTGLGRASGIDGSESGAGGSAIDSVYTTLDIEDLATAVKTAPVSSYEGAYSNIQVLTSGTTYTPTTGMKSCLVHCTGGGGAGGGQHNESNRYGVAGHGGAGGTAIRSYSAAQMGATATISIGSGGTTNGTSAGNAGSNTTFTPAGSGTALTGGGGSGGSAFTVSETNYNQTPATNGAGGSASGGMWNITGREAENSFTATHYDSDTGDNPPCGSGGSHTHNGPVVSVRSHPAESALSMMGPDYGRGGLGSMASQTAGTAGKAGAIVVYEWT